MPPWAAGAAGRPVARIAGAIEATGGTALTVVADVSDAAQAAAAVQRTVTELGRLDVVVNNAGLMRTGPATQAPLQDWDDLVAVNIQGCCMSRERHCLFWSRRRLTHRAE